MAEYGEWNKKGSTLSDVSAQTEYGVNREFIVKGIKANKLEYRDGEMWGNPYLRVIRRQLESYISEELGQEYLKNAKNKAELQKINKEIAGLKKKQAALLKRKNELEALLLDK